MARKNFKVATTEKGKTALVKIEKETKVPTGKVITLEDKKKRKEAREQQYKDFRIAALKRRAKRMNLSDEEINAAVKKLTEQLSSPNNYMILLMYTSNIKDIVEQTILNEKMKWLFKSNEHMYLEGDAKTLAKIRELVPDGVKVHPYVKKHPPILKVEDPPKIKKKRSTKAEKKLAAKNAKIKRKKERMEAFKNRKKSAGKAWSKVQKQIRLLKYAKNELKNKSKSQRKATIATVTKIVKEGKKNASKTLKNAA